MARLKVLFIAAWYPSRENPMAGIFVREHAKAVQLYNEVTVLHCPGPDPMLKKDWQLEQEMKEEFTQGIPTYRLAHRYVPTRRLMDSPYFKATLLAFEQIVAGGFFPDVLHAHVYTAGVAAVLLGMLHHIPVVITEHLSVFPRKLLPFREVSQAKFAFGAADFVLPVSLSLQEAIQDYGIHAKFQVVPNVANPIFFDFRKHGRRPSPQKRLLFVGRLVPVKGVSYLLRALAQLRRQRDDWHLDVVGEGPSRVKYEQMAAHLGIANRVTFHGLKPREAIAQWMREADLFILPSLSENCPTVVVEALATGTPVLATRCGGTEELLTKNIGLLVTPGDAEALCCVLNDMLERLACYHPDSISRYALKHFSREQVGKRLHSIYASCLAQHPSMRSPWE